MRFSSIALPIICAFFVAATTHNAFAHDKNHPHDTTAAGIENERSLYIEMINENEVVLNDKKITLAELEDFLRNKQNDQPEKQVILYITDTQFVNHAYRFAYDMRHSIKKHIWVTYRP